MPKVNSNILLFITVAIVICAALALGNPHSTNWIIKCPLHYFTGLQCPFCGLQRMLHELLLGNIKEAWKLNPGLFLLSPYYIILLFGQLFPTLQQSSKLIRFCYRNNTIFFFLALTIAWGIIRNF